ncbi:transcription initiation factor TFIID subunit 1-like isoform X2 [Mercenaria mercenaria]|uniref:transcription initiation factor TFIID subunit 1-like isoform X2 n=1 Tax=Mercenaria mercenaria TaxID=6596 RepID=UPI00234F97B5|nr:transcription initiation factor TFIID subunit 1-like isoform X2 [Mercenaria mercenaria]
MMDIDDSEQSSAEAAVSSLTGFLFGNIDEKGELEEDFLDEESKKHLGSLSALGIGSLVREITDDAEQIQDSSTDLSPDYEKKASDAVDFSDIVEVADEEEEDKAKISDAMSSMHMLRQENDDDDYDDKDSQLMPPPSWLPSQLKPDVKPTINVSGSIASNGMPGLSESSAGLTNTTPSLNTPLAAMLPPELKNADVTKYFPEFRKNQVLRFSRLFKPVHHPHIWKRKKKKKEDGEEEKDKKKEEKGKESAKVETNTSKTEEIKPKEEPGTTTSATTTTTQESVSAEAVISEPQSTPTSDIEIKVEEPSEAGSQENKDMETSGSQEDKSDSGISGVGDDEEEDYDDYVAQLFGTKIKLNMGRPALPEEMAPSDEELLKMKESGVITKSEKKADGSTKEGDIDVAPWRYGPAQYWYDMLGVNETGEGFDYGFKLKKEPEEKKETEEIKQEPGTIEESVKVEPPQDLPDEAFLMITQLQWEEDIIWSGEEARQRVMQAQKTRPLAAGWIPSTSHRTAAQYLQQNRPGIQTRLGPGNLPIMRSISGQFGQKPETPGGGLMEQGKDNQWFSIFPIENQDLVYGNWEDEIIWDSENMDYIPSPKTLTIDPNDDNIILEIPEDKDPSAPETPAKKEKSEVKKSRILLGKAGIIKDEEEEDSPQQTNSNIDPFNMSNDEFYNPKLLDTALRSNMGVNLIQHSTPAVELQQPFFPTFLSETKLRTFHRNPLKKYSHGALATPGPHPVDSLFKVIKRKARLRDQERQAFGGGEIFFMRTPQDLTGQDGELILCEHSEEYPPLMVQIGMATKIKNYYKRKPGKDSVAPQYKYGEIAYAHSSPFLGTLLPGQCQQALENNMFRAPIYEHKMAPTDFLIIRTRNHFYIRDVETIFCVGQQNPLYEVPGPNSKRANNFIRDFLQVFIYRLFWKSKDNPRRIKMDDIKKAFPSHSESSIRKRLKLCADFKRTGMDSNWWVLKPDFRLKTEEEMRNMVSPEQCCGYYSMLAAEQRLKDAGYGEKSFLAPEEDNEEETQLKIEDEVKTAPWNTTRAYISAMKGKCLLDLNGVADPTGVGEGFSYIKVPNKPQPRDEGKDNTPQKKTVTGTDADLRKLYLKDAKNLLRKFGVPEHEIKKLSRWEVIDVVRTMSTEQAKAAAQQEVGHEGGGWNKFARGNRFSVAEHQERYKEECQRLFDLQNKILSSTEHLSTDEASSSEDSEFEEIGKNLESMLSNKKTSSQIKMEREEAERRELQRMMMEGKDDKQKKDSVKQEEDPMASVTGKKLKITRVFVDDNGREFTRVEWVLKPAVIDAYVRIQKTKDPNFIKQFATMDDAAKEEMRRERRRLQEQLRRIKRNEEKDKAAPDSSAKKKKKKEVQLLKSKMKCGACGQTGHMRTNKECPNYNKTVGSIPAPVQVAMTEEEEEKQGETLQDHGLVDVVGTKLKLSKSLIEHAEQIKRKSLVLKFPKQAMESKKRKKAGTTIHCDYLKKPRQSANRRRADPVVTMSSIFEQVLNEMRDMPNTHPFLYPVSAKNVPDYFKIVKEPMDLQHIRENLRAKKYKSREDFLLDVNLIMKNSSLYNGPKSTLTMTAQSMLDHCLRRLAEKEDKLMRLEKAINPLLDDNDQVAFSFILENILNRIKLVDNTWPFQNPVNKKIIKDYYDVIEQPMDLASILKKIQSHQYQSKEGFIGDIQLILDNSIRYNGKDHAFTTTAKKMLDVCRSAIQENDETITQLEKDIRAAQEAALEAAESESVVTGTSITHDDLAQGLDNESLDSYSMGTSKEGVTIKEYTEMDESNTGVTQDSQPYFQGVSMSDSDFVDIEGDEDSFTRKKVKKEMKREAFEGDMDVTPDRMEEENDILGKLSDDSEDEKNTQEDLVQQGYTYMEDEQSCMESAASQQYQVQPPQLEDENSFDPSEFFRHSALASQAAAEEEQNQLEDQPMDTVLNNDLEVSESESENEGQANDQGEDSNEGFDIEEFLQ